ncbi:cyclic nucleotide-gated cation channel beta-3-like [Dreissena polymorpha]|uniref:Uncharacterized protein n=1 Tax=Dreissena polymorpha TaxID=45954 RepID=A0A9D3YUT7_DREPO|nr:cyclic nucleotide-gated cation channel beta-3-like [Dreissena polymorpha]KAH3705505.1 hypothetical protein DPMN_080581 [Dreissena polymorpha]
MDDNDSDDNSTEYENMPSHLIVQKQLQDLVSIQKARVARLQESVNLQNETLKGNFVPREQYDTELSSLQESLRSDYVPRDQYDSAVRQLEDEKVEHAATHVRLQEALGKLEQAVAEVNNLQEQLLQQKAHYEKQSGSLKSKTMQETAKTMKLQSKCSEMARHCEQQEAVLSAKDSEIAGLERRLKEQELLYRKEVSESDIEKKQQRYIATVLAEEERKKSRTGTTSHLAVPKTKPKR